MPVNNFTIRARRLGEPVLGITEMAVLMSTLRAAETAKRRARGYAGLVLAVWSGLLIVLVALAAASYMTCGNEFATLTSTTLFGGVAAFGFTPPFLRLASRHRVIVPALAVVTCAGLGYCAYLSDGIERHLLVELAVAVLLVSCLDQLLKAALRRLSTKHKAYADVANRLLSTDWSRVREMAASESRG